MNYIKKWGFFLLFVNLSCILFSQEELLKWDFSGTNGAVTSTADVINSDVSATSGVISIGSGLQASSYLGGDGFTVSKQLALTLSEAIASNEYLTFSIAPVNGKELTITKLRIKPLSQNRERTFTVFSNQDGFAVGSELGSFVYKGNTGSNSFFDVPLSDYSKITGAIEFRVYIHGGSGDYESTGFSTKNGYDFIVEGSVQNSSGDDGSFNPFHKTKELQLGIGGTSYYGRPLYANALYMETRGWRSTDAINYPVEDNQINENGFPLYLTPNQLLYAQPGQNSGANKPAYGGRICVTWKGEADVRATSTYLTSPTPQTGSFSNGKRYYDNGSTPNGVKIIIYAVNPNNPPTDIKVWLNDLKNPSKSLDPAEQGGKEYLINPAYADFFADEAFHLYRFMNFSATNHSDITVWQNRRKPEHCFRNGEINGETVGGVYEDMIEICNIFKKDMWLCTPAMADENFVKNLAKLIDGQDPDGNGCPGLDTDLRCYIEYGNEMGWTYWKDYCDNQAALEGIGGREYAGRQAARVHSWFRSIVGEDNLQYKFIHCIQSSSYSVSNSELLESCIVTGPSLSPSGVPDYIGVTSYFGSNIEEYVFDEINYWDPAVKEEELQKVFFEFEKRSLNQVASVTGVDFTSGVSTAGQLLSEEYGLPLIAYEGGCGLNLAGNNCVDESCKLAPKDTEGLTCKYFLKDLAAQCGGSDNFLNFIRSVHTHPLMKEMFYLNMSMAKAAGLQTVSQFGDIGDINSNIDYGYWSCVNDLNQDPQDAHRYQFWLEWNSEQKDIREVWDSLGTRPKFNTLGELYPARVNEAYIQEITFGGGDGTLTLDMINRDVVLPASLTFSEQPGKIVISGTPAAEDIGTYYFMYRVLDGDKDPAYAVYTLRILPAPLNTLFAYDDFGDISSSLEGSSTGFGFANAWNVQNDNLENYLILTDNPFAYNSLQVSGGAYARGGGSFLTSGRELDVATFDYLRQSTNPDVIGQTNTSMWFSSLVQRTTNTNGQDVYRFTNSKYYQSRNEAEIIVLIDDNGKWALDIRNDADNDFIRYSSDVNANIDEVYLLVIEFNFDLEQDKVYMYINPDNLGGIAPNVSPDVSFISNVGRDITLSRIGFRGADSPAVNIDDLRFGDTYRAVTPTGTESTELPIVVSAKMINGTSDVLELRINGNTVKTWTVSGATYADYTYNGYTGGANNIRLYFQDNGTDMQVDYLKIDGTVYQAENQAVNTSTWQDGSCGGSYSDKMYCPGYIEFSNTKSGTVKQALVVKDSKNASVLVYPNPANSFITISNIGDNAMVRIYNIQGQTVLQNNNLEGETSLDISTFSRGLYLLEIEQQNNIIKQKFIKE